MERVRFAPSPTGPLHIGGVRTALFNYLYTKNQKGSFIVRVEDTDQNRYVEGAEAYILDTLAWLGLDVDESPSHGGEHGPYRQSERKEIYHQYAAELVALGKAYYAFDSKEELDRERQKDEIEKQTFKYSVQNRLSLSNSLTVSDEETNDRIKNGEFVIRLKNSGTGSVTVYDELRGNVTVSASEIDDKILMKADGMPTYHFANVVDDHLMQITCVIRGEEWLPSLPLHKLIYDAFGWDTPNFIHLPLILKPEGKGKLSKRDGDKGGFPVFPIQWHDTIGFREQGFIKEGLLNYLALLGWNEGTDKEIYTLEELVNSFGLAGIQKGGARFDIKKAKWVNAQHLKEKESSYLETLLDLDEVERRLEKIELIKDRAETTLDLKALIDLFEMEPSGYDEKVVKKLSVSSCRNLLSLTKEAIMIDKGITKEKYFSLIESAKMKVGAGMQSLRLALIGSLQGPDIFQFVDLLDKKTILVRIENFDNFLKTKQ